MTESHGHSDAPHTFPADRVFPGDGEMARLCREFDWSSTPLGPVGGWPLALRVMVSTVLRAEQPMLVFWGPELIQLYNDGFRPLLGNGEEHPAALGAPARAFWRAIWGEIGDQVEAAYGQGASTLRENRLIPIHRDGAVEDVYWSYSYSPLPDDDGAIGGVLVVCRETTEDLRATMETEREALRNLEEQAALLDRAPDAILVRELDHSIDYWNAGAERLYGWARKEVMGRSARELLYDDPTPFDQATRIVLEEGEWAGELVHRRRNGEAITVDGRWSLVRNEDGTPRRILSINTDATERKKLLGQFLRAQRMESIGTLAGGIAHDLNNVLSPILLSIAMLKEDLADPSNREVLDGIEESAKRGAEMVKQVLAFAGGIEGVQTRLDLQRITGELDRVVRDTFPRNIRFEYDLPDDLRALSGDPTQVHQVLMNLLVNARDAMPHGGVVSLEARNVELDAHSAAMSPNAQAGPHICLSVTDTGEGMPPEVINQIFDPFFTTKEVGDGTGLGLSTVAAIVSSHGGFVNVYSEVGSGTTLRVYLPSHPTSEGGRTEEEVAPGTEALPRGRGELILVVDDERSVRDVTRQTLEAFGYRVETATDGADAVATYARLDDEVELVLTDLMMPIMDGPATIRALRRMNPELKIIAASGLGTDGGVTKAVDAGVARFLPKPYTAETLLQTIRAVLEEG